MPTMFEFAAFLLTLVAASGWLNQRFVGLPRTTALLVLGAAFSAALFGADMLGHRVGLDFDLSSWIGEIDFSATVLQGMLGFLLFAGALHVEFDELRTRRWTIFAMATVGVVISTAIVGIGLWLVAPLLGYPITLPWALVFGALISPTDPVAVLGTIKRVGMPDGLGITMTGESLFNDGVGIALFTLLLRFATEGGQDISALEVVGFFALEALGAIILGAVAGWIAFRALKVIDERGLEVLITLALVAGTYAVAERFEMSGPIAVVICGLIIGNLGTRYAMSEATLAYLRPFWDLTDEVLNALLFFLIGLETLALAFDPALGWPAASAVPLALLARLVAVSSAVGIMSFITTFPYGTVRILTWGGVRGGISIALALSLPQSEARPLILAATYLVVLTTLLLQAPTLAPLVRSMKVKGEQA